MINRSNTAARFLSTCLVNNSLDNVFRTIIPWNIWIAPEFIFIYMFRFWKRLFTPLLLISEPRNLWNTVKCLWTIETTWVLCLTTGTQSKDQIYSKMRPKPKNYFKIDSFTIHFLTWDDLACLFLGFDAEPLLSDMKNPDILFFTAATGLGSSIE